MSTPRFEVNLVILPQTPFCRLMNCLPIWPMLPYQSSAIRE